MLESPYCQTEQRCYTNQSNAGKRIETSNLKAGITVTCPECQRLKESKEEYWKAYQRQKQLNHLVLFKEVKPTEEIEHLLEEYKISSARLRSQLAIKHTDYGHRVSEQDG
jgi:hypothetical protein